MELIVDREVRTRNTTSGILYVDGKFECFTLEDVDRGLKSTMPKADIAKAKVYGETAIPEGRYQVTITHSPKFRKPMPLLNGIPCYEAVRIHPGNTKADTLGCILVGQKRGIDYIGNSRHAFDILFQKISKAINSGEKVFITIKN